MTTTRRALVGLALFGLLAVIWVLGVAPSAGPDEPSHVIRGAALIRGQFDGEYLGPSLTVYELPNHIGHPDPACFAFDPTAAASCATAFGPADGDGRLVSTSDSYPIWGHLAAGIGTLLPAGWSGPGARLFDAAIPLLLLVASLLAARRRGRLPMAAAGFAVTVPLWFAIVVVNPSGLVVAGGIALWVGLLSPAPQVLSRLERVLVIGGWAAMVLPRRDGMVYATLVVAAALLLTSAGLSDRWRQLGRVGQALIVGPTVVMLVWAIGSRQTSTRMLVVVPLILVAAVGARDLWRRVATTEARAAGLAAAGAVAGLVASFAVMSLRGDGFDSDILQAVIGQTGIDLLEAVGLIGWLDTPVPQTMVFLWFVGLGMLAGAALMNDDRRRLFGAATIVAVAIWVSWILTMLQNDDNGLYWQGRYYLPFLVGVPLLLGHTSVTPAQARRLARTITAIGLIVLTFGFGAAMRRWGVGVTGSLMPWRWDTYNTPIPPILLLWFHVLVAGGLWWWYDQGPDDAALPAADANPGDDAEGVNVVGYHHVSSGLGSIARSMSTTLRSAGIPTIDVDIALTNSPQRREPTPVPDELHRTSIVVATASEIDAVAAALGPVFEASAVTAGYWFWELADVPADHVAAATTVDEVWAATRFVADAYRSAIDDRPVRLVPIPLTAPAIDRRLVRAWRARLVPNETRRRSGFLFVVSLDLLSVVDRKNPFAAIDAFRRAFDPSRSDASDHCERVRLVVKTINGDRLPDDLARIVDAAGDDDRIAIVDEHVTAGELDALIAAADCYVSLHRSEGLGLHLATAMWSGTPVLATAYGGNIDLMDDDSAALVGYDLVPVGDTDSAYPGASVWADPDVDAAAAWMTRMADDATVGTHLTVAARARMEAQLDPSPLVDAVGELVERATRSTGHAIR